MSTLTPLVQSQATERIVGQGSDAFERVRLRRDALEASGIDGLIVPARVALQSHDAVVVTEPTYEGVTLQDVLLARGSLHAGECVWWAAQVAQLLASLHKVGIAHGALSAEAIVIDGDRIRLGRLVDGDHTASGPDDVAALGELLARSVRADEAARVEAWAEPMRHERADARPSAAMVARAITSCAPAQPLEAPARDVVGSMRRRAGAVQDVERVPGAWWWRVRVAARKHWRVAAMLVGATAVLGIALAVAVASMGGRSVAPDVQVGAQSEAPMLVAQETPVDAATRLILSRFDAMVAGDGQSLVALTVPGSAAHADAEATAALFAQGRLAFTPTSAMPSGADISVQLDELVTADEAGSGSAIVLVSYLGPAYDVTFDNDSTVVEAEHVHIRMELVWDEAVGWRVAEASQAVARGSESTT